MFEMLFKYFVSDPRLPFFIQYGFHDANMYEHRHSDFCEIVTVLDGTAINAVGEQRYSVKRGDIFVMREGTVHGYIQPEGFRICNLMISTEKMKELEQDLSDISGFCSLFLKPLGEGGAMWMPPDVFNETAKLISKMIVEYDASRAGRVQMLSSLLTQFILTVSRYYGTPMKKCEKIGIERAAVYLEEHYMEDSPVKKAGELSHYSQRHFERLFSDTYGITPSRYLIDVRIKHARSLLVTSDMPIATIAQQCGFCDASYFTKVFRENTGVSPRNYRMSE